MSPGALFDALLWLAQVWWSWISAVALQFCAPFLVVEALRRLFALRVPPRICFALWLAVLLKLALPPDLASPLSLAGYVTIGLGLGPDISATAAGTARAIWPLPLFCLWAAVTLTLTLAGLRRHRLLRHRILARSRRLEAGELPTALGDVARRLGLRRTPPVLACAGLGAPAVMGLLRPAVLLPERWLSSATERALCEVLLHELAHVRRRDPLVAAALLPLQLAFWFHPLVWVARRRLSDAAELCCDEIAARSSSYGVESYARTLRRAVSDAIEPNGVGLLAMAGRATRLEERLQALERCAPRPYSARTWPLFVWLLMIAAVLPTRPVRPSSLPVSEAPSPLAPTVTDVRTAVFGADGRHAGSLQVRYAVLARLAAESSDPTRIDQGDPP